VCVWLLPTCNTCGPAGRESRPGTVPSACDAIPVRFERQRVHVCTSNEESVGGKGDGEQQVVRRGASQGCQQMMMMMMMIIMMVMMCARKSVRAK
jgi:hypothetical protein